MARDDSSDQPSIDRTDIQRMFEAAASGLSTGELEDLLQQVLGSASRAWGALAERPMPSRRRPRRPDVVTYRVRIDLDGARPPLWRRLELASDLFLDDVHDIIQVAFGWTDSHLHQFASGPRRYGPETESYLCPFEVDEGKVGVPEDQVRLDEVLVDVGEKLFYTYDFGDDWQHTIKLEAVTQRDGAAPRAVCTTGRRPGPPEDCGGLWGYEVIAAATDPDHPDHEAATGDFEQLYGDGIESDMLDLLPFDVDEVNVALTDLGLDEARPPSERPAPLDELVSAVRPAAEKRQLRTLLGAARLDEPVEIDAAAATRMVHPYTWLLDRVGDDGITLTGAGYLPPVHVSATVSALGLADEWIGKGNREIQTLPVLHLRESAQRMGLLRKHRGTLLLTAHGRRVRTDPLALWWHLAERMPLTSKDEFEHQAGMILLVTVAANATGDLDEIVGMFLDAIGWLTSDNTPITGSMASRGAWDTRMVLRRVGALAAGRGVGWQPRPTEEGVVFARAAMQTWA